MADDGLSQEDFRKLLQTPRPGSETSTTRFKPPAPKAPSAVFARPASVKHKKKRNHDEGDGSVKSNYRDRAAERRDGEQGEATSEQQTTEDLLRPMEQGEALDAQQVYEQSKYLGGDTEHTHLVKGLDFTLLNKVRRQMEQDTSSTNDNSDGDNEDDENGAEATVTDEQAEVALDDALDRLDRGEKVVDDMEDALALGVSDLSVAAKALNNLFTRRDDATTVHELFRPGRMAFSFPVESDSDPFAIPTAVIRSKADINEKQQLSTQASGWSDDALQESELVLSKVVQVMIRSRQQQEQQRQKKELENQRITTAPSVPVSNIHDDDDDDDNLLFSDVEGDYVLDESTIGKNKQSPVDETTTRHTNYFMDNDDTEMEQNEEASDILANAMAGETTIGKKRTYDTGPEETMDTDSQDIDMFGLSTTALPTSFADRQRMVVMDDDEQDDTRQQATLLVDQGTHKNKKAQLSRWDFDDEEQWQHYKSTVEIQPKSAAQFGVKMGDGRKRNKERRVMSEKQKLNRDYQQVKGIMEKKYGKS
ncbi:RED-like protein N-terminal region-domain-containing protein [Chlamydoabsidia padenii]|nr:RED-like protein N-terminal region-domain-containing protein [Chlamydoabsidia padenii]